MRKIAEIESLKRMIAEEEVKDKKLASGSNTPTKSPGSLASGADISPKQTGLKVEAETKTTVSKPSLLAPPAGPDARDERIENLEDELNDAREELKREKKTNGDLRGNLDDAHDELQRERKMNYNLKRDLKEAVGEATRLSRQFSDAEAAAIGLNRELTNADQRIFELDNRMREGNDALRANQQLQHEIRELQRVAEERRRQLEEKEKETKLGATLTEVTMLRKIKEAVMDANMENEEKMKANEAKRKYENEIWRYSEMITMNPSGAERKKLEEAIAKRKACLAALDQPLDKVPINWATLSTLTTGSAVVHTLDSGSMQLETDGVKHATQLAIKSRPFAKGAFRFAYYGVDRNQPMVFKTLIFSRDPVTDEKEHEENVKLQLLSDYYIKKFNAIKPATAPRMRYVGARLYEMNGVRYFGEDVLPGKFVKYNNNSTYVNPDPEGALAQTFSHFTYHMTGGKLLICDIQGCYDVARKEFVLTDPACHTTVGVKEFGDSNLGQKGMDLFFSVHECNQFCKEMRLELPRVPR